MHEEYVSLENLGAGAALELFEVELQKVLDNISDENTKPTAPREVSLKIRIKPDEDRAAADVSIQAGSKLAPVRPYSTQIVFGIDHGQNVAREHNPKQLRFGEAPDPSKVIEMNPREKAGDQ